MIKEFMKIISDSELYAVLVAKLPIAVLIAWLSAMRLDKSRESIGYKVPFRIDLEPDFV